MPTVMLGLAQGHTPSGPRATRPVGPVPVSYNILQMWEGCYHILCGFSVFQIKQPFPILKSFPFTGSFSSDISIFIKQKHRNPKPTKQTNTNCSPHIPSTPAKRWPYFLFPIGHLSWSLGAGPVRFSSSFPKTGPRPPMTHGMLNPVSVLSSSLWPIGNIWHTKNHAPLFKKNYANLF